MPSVPILKLYRSLYTYLLQRIPDDCDSRLTNLIFLMMGLFQARNVQLNLVARKTPIRAQKLSIVKRLTRFLDNPAVRVREWYHPFAEPLLHSAAQSGQFHLIIDASKVAFGFRLVMVSVVGDSEFGHPLLLENLRFWGCASPVIISSCCGARDAGSGLMPCRWSKVNPSGLVACS